MIPSQRATAIDQRLTPRAGALCICQLKVGLRSCQPLEPFLPFGTANGQSELSYREFARGVLMSAAGSQSKFDAAVNRAAAGVAVITIAALGMWLFLVSF